MNKMAYYAVDVYGRWYRHDESLCRRGGDDKVVLVVSSTSKPTDTADFIPAEVPRQQACWLKIQRWQ